MKKKLFSIRIVVLLILLLQAFASTSVNGVKAQSPTTLYVSTTGDDTNDCITTSTTCATINGAIGKSASGDTIYVAIGTYAGTGSEVILIDKGITLSGGWDETFTAQIGRSTIDGQEARRGINVSSSVNVSIENFVIQNGLGDLGGGIRNYLGTLTVSNSQISRNYGTLMGGGIYNQEGNLTINKTAFNNNVTGDPCCSGGGGGGGIANNGGTVSLNNSQVSNNKIIGSFNGSGVYSSGTMDINNSSINNNTNGDGIDNSWGSMTINNSTISGNISNSYSAGGITNHATLTLNNSTVSNNSSQKASGGITNIASSWTTSVVLQNSIVANNQSKINSPDCSGKLTSAGYNIIRNTTGCTISSAAGDQFNVNPQLGAFLPAKGYQPLLSTSPAINAGNPATCQPADQRGVNRFASDTACDIGAYEYTVPGSASEITINSGNLQRTSPSSSLEIPLQVFVADNNGSPVANVAVTFTAPSSGPSGIFSDSKTPITTATTNQNGIAVASTFTTNNESGVYDVITTADGVSNSAIFTLNNIAWYVALTGNDSNTCQSPEAPCLTINGAIAKAPDEDTINIATGKYIGTGDEVVLLDKDIKLLGGWDSGFTTQNERSIIDGEATRRVILLTNGSVVFMDRFIIQNGYSGDGGGIENWKSDLTINNSIIRGNKAGDPCCTGGGGGAGINNSEGNITINNSTISGNKIVGGFSGGGIYTYGGLIEINNSTISNNSGGGMYGVFKGDVILVNSTVSGNRGSGFSLDGTNLTVKNSTITENRGDGIYRSSYYGSAVTIQNSIVAGNISNDCVGVIISNGYNLIGKNIHCSFTRSRGDKVGTETNPIDPYLGPLQNNGGPTFTHALASFSPALNAGNPATPGSGGKACLATDQRGVKRPKDTACDIGAFEGYYLPTVPPPLKPNGSAFTATPTFTWMKIPKASKYQLQLMKGQTIVYEKIIGISACGSGTCSITPTTVLIYPATYKWRVRAMIAGTWRDYSEYKTFSIPAARDGFWNGRGLEFYVDTAHQYVSKFSIFVNITGCGSYKITYPYPAPIKNKGFSFGNPNSFGSFYANGTFSSPTKANGKLGLNWYYLPGCGYVDGGPFSWSAIWKNFNQPSSANGQEAITVNVLPTLDSPFDTFTVDTTTP